VKSTPSRARATKVRERAEDRASPLRLPNPNLTETLLASIDAGAAMAPPSPAVRRVVEDLERTPNVVTVGLFDLDAQIAGLGRLIDALNETERVFTFFEVLAPLPAGLVVVDPEHVVEMARKRTGQRFRKADLADLAENFLFDDFRKFGRVVREGTGVDYLVGITRYKVAWTSSGEFGWNYFTASSGRTILLSIYQLREYAAKAGRSVEVAVVGMAIAEVLVSLNRRLHYHEDRGCMFDFNQERETIVESIRQARIDDDCLKRIDEPYRDAAVALNDALRKYDPPKHDPPAKPKTGKATDDYWLTQLKDLGHRLRKR